MCRCVWQSESNVCYVWRGWRVCTAWSSVQAIYSIYKVTCIMSHTVSSYLCAPFVPTYAPSTPWNDLLAVCVCTSSSSTLSPNSYLHILMILTIWWAFSGHDSNSIIECFCKLVTMQPLASFAVHYCATCFSLRTKISVWSSVWKSMKSGLKPSGLEQESW